MRHTRNILGRWVFTRMTPLDRLGEEGLPSVETHMPRKPDCRALAASLIEQCAAVEQLTARLTRGAADMCDSTADVLAFVLNLSNSSSNSSSPNGRSA